jgi:hypothetical protein
VAAARSGPAAAAREELAKVGTRSARAPVKKATGPAKAAPARPRPTDEGGAAVPDAPADAAPGTLPPVTEMEAAWPAIAERLKGASKGMFRDARFDVVDDTVHVTVPPGPPIDQLEKRWPEVQQALASHFGAPVSAQLVIGSPGPVDPPEPVPDDEPVDVHDLEDAPAAGSGVERLAEAFPGAELVDE